MPAAIGGRARAPRLPARRLAAAAADGRALPLHATARRQVPARRSRRSPCRRCTSSTCSATPAAPWSPVGMLDRAPRRRSGTAGWAGELGEYRTGVGGLAAPVRTVGRAGRRGAGRRGPVEELFGGGGMPAPRLVEQLLERGAGDLGRAGGTGGWRGDRYVSSRRSTRARRRPAACCSTRRAGWSRSRQREHRQHYPRPGWVEHDAEEIWRNVTRIVPAALRSAGLGPQNIVALGIANQRETTVIWDRHTGVPLARAITWQDTRTDGIVARLVDDGRAALVDAAVRAAARHLLRRAAAALAARPRRRARGPAPRRATCCSGPWRAG